MGRSTTSITLDKARAIIKAQKLTRTSWSSALNGIRPQPMGAELTDDGAVIFWYRGELFAEYTK